MFLARVEGSVVSTKKEASMNGRKLLLLRPQLVDDKDPTKFRPGQNTIVAVDSVGAGVGELVMFCQGSSARLAAEALGNGIGLSAQDTVPFALWCAAHNPDHFERAMRVTVSGGGDMDTNCAIIGGIVALSAGADSIPREWLHRREPLPQWVYVDMAQDGG